MKNATRIILFTALLLVVVGSITYVLERVSTKSSVSYMSGGSVDLVSATAYWEKRISSIGAKRARVEYLSAGEELPLYQAHTLAHSFGEALFSTQGPSGFSLCGEEFNYGCFHQLIGSAIVHDGTEVVKSFADVCTKLEAAKAISCGHGLGHGVTGYIGYATENLHTSFSLCEKSGLGTLQMSCVSGVIMEYNFRRMVAENEKKNEVRPLVENNRYTPCSTLEKPYRSVCVFQLPLWWVNALTSQGEEASFATWQRIGNFCVDAPDRGECFAGIGYIAAGRSGLDEERASNLCRETTGAAQDLFNCVRGMIHRLSYAGKNPTDALCLQFDFSETLLNACWEAILSGFNGMHWSS